MTSWTSLSEVEEARTSGKKMTFAPALVWAANHIASSPYPRKFTYSACPGRGSAGLSCGKSLEFGPKCAHTLAGIPKYRFQLLLFDAHHSQCSPLTAQVWDCASTLLGLTALEFSRLSEMYQMNIVQSILQCSPKLEVTVAVKDMELHIQSLSVVKDICPSPLTLHSGSGSSSSTIPRTPRKPKSAKKILNDLIEALQQADLED